MKLIPLPAFTDNYIWLLHDDHHALVVDPGDAAVVLSWLEDNPQVRLDTILVTHHHPDHTGGLRALVEHTQAKIHGPAKETMPLSIEGHHGGETVHWHELNMQVIDVPGHTAGHIAFWTEVPGQTPLLFCGDTLFSGGCGRLFEGTPAQMLDSLDRLAALPSNTRVCPAHEYTLSNLKFALAVDPDNASLLNYHQVCTQLRRDGQPTLPSTVLTEKAINPFLRSRSNAIMAAVQQRQAHAQDDVATFAALRAWKNEFK